ncbi:MAG: zinc-ribbon domain-containing protein, partial [Myxococcota bacterium]
MDVTCERCGTVYEFDETLVSGRGTTVKCTQCNHVFKVTPGGATRSPRSGWQVRRQDGAVMEVESLKVLQRRIGQGHLSRDDTISRDGTTWKRLGDIAELQSFFDTAQAAAPPARERRQTQLGVGVTPPADAAGEQPTGAPQPERAPEPPGPAAPHPETTRPAEEAGEAEATRPAAGGGRQHKSTLLGMGLPGADTAGPTEQA